MSESDESLPHRYAWTLLAAQSLQVAGTDLDVLSYGFVTRTLTGPIITTVESF